MHEEIMKTKTIEELLLLVRNASGAIAYAAGEEIKRRLAAQQGFAPDVAYWMCERCGDFWHKDYHVCQTCDSPRR